MGTNPPSGNPGDYGGAGDWNGSAEADQLTNDFAGTVNGDMNGQGGDDTLVNKGSINGNFIGGAGSDYMLNSGRTSFDMLGSVNAAGVSGGGNVLINDNSVAGDMYGSKNAGIGANGGSNSITNSGRIWSDIFGSENRGEDSAGGSNLITNSGTAGDIYGAKNYGLNSSGGSNSITNSGTADDIYGSHNVNLGTNGGSNSITNSGTAATIYGSYNERSTNTGGSNIIANSGHVTSNVFGSFNRATNSEGGGNSILNTGQVDGTIYGSDNGGASSVGSGNVIFNSGAATASSIYGARNAGANSSGGSNAVTNSGHVTSDVFGSANDGQSSVGGGNSVNNSGQVDGTIYGSGNGGASSVGGSNTILNSGDTSDTYGSYNDGVQSSGGSNFITNSGSSVFITGSYNHGTGASGGSNVIVNSGLTLDIIGSDNADNGAGGGMSGGSNSITNTGLAAGNIAGSYNETEYSVGNSNVIDNSGYVAGAIYGSYNDGDHVTGGSNTITNSGDVFFEVFGSYNDGDYSSGGSNIISNSGVVDTDLVGSANEGDYSTGGSNVITNTGHVAGDVFGSANDGLKTVGGGNSILNTGRVDGTIYGSDSLGAQTVSPGNVIVNRGSVGVDIYGSHNSGGGCVGGNDVITNSGYVGGDIRAEDGDDRVNIETGSNVVGTVDGGTGADTLAFSGFGDVHSDLWGTKYVNFEALAFYDGATSLSGNWNAPIPITVESGGTMTLVDGATANVNSLTVDSGGQAIIDGSFTANAFDVNSGGRANINGQARINGTTSISGKLDFSYAGRLNTGMLNIYSGGEVQIATDDNLGDLSTGVQLRGGTLKASDSLYIQREIVAHAQGGTIDNNGFGVTLAGALSGVGPLTFTGSAATTLSGDGSGYGGSTTLSSGRLRLASGAVLGGSLTVDSGATLSGYGTLGSVTNNGILAPGGSIGTLAVNGNYAQGETGVYYQEISPDGLGDRLLVGGSASLGGALVVDAPSGEYYPTGARWSVIEASGGVTGAFSSIQQPFSSPTLFFLPAYEGTAVAVTAERAAYATYARDGRSAAAGYGLNQAARNASGNLAELITALDFSDGATINQALDALSPEPYDAFTQSGFDAGRALSAVQRSRPLADGQAVSGAAAISGGVGDATGLGMSSGSASFGDDRRYAFFLEPFGMFASQGGLAERTGYAAYLGGVACGVGISPAPGLFVGLSPAYMRRNLSIHSSFGASGSVDSWSLALTGAYRHGPWRFDGLLRGGVDSYASSRTVTLPTTSYAAEARWTGFSAALELGGGYDFTHGETTFGPFASVGWQSIQQDGFSEYGALGLGQRVDARLDHSLNTTLGARVTRTFMVKDMAVTPELRLGWTAEWLGAPRTLDASFTAAPGSGFSVRTAENGYHAAVVDFGVTAKISDALSAEARFGAELFRPGYEARTANVSLRYTF